MSIIYNSIINLVFIISAIGALVNTDMLKGKLILASIAVIVYVLPQFIHATPSSWKWMLVYLLKIGFALFCLVYIKVKRLF